MYYGVAYPNGGSVSIAQGMLGNILEAHGKVVVKARVKNVLVRGNTAYGVRLESGELFYADKIVSACSTKIAIKLLPERF